MSNVYDEIPYPTMADARLHVENLRVHAVLNGFAAEPPATARVLEIGCGNGFNLAPMAETYPEAFFLGVDSAASAIELGNGCMRQAGLTNIDLLCGDLREMARIDAVREFGKFDYVIAHGFYSWVPEDAREAMWDLARKVLAPAGIFHVSFNALPGWYAAGAIRDLAGFLGEPRDDGSFAYDRTWEALGVLANYADSGNLFAAEAARIRNRARNVLAHDELTEACEPFYLTHVVRRAAQKGFRYVAEAGFYVPPDLRKHEDVAKMVLELSGGDPLLQLQLLDFTAMRRFHNTLLTHEANTPKKRHVVNTLLDCWARSDIRFVETDDSGARVYEHSGGTRLASSHPLLCALADALEGASPGSVHLGEFLADCSPDDGANHPQRTLQFGQLVVRLMETGVIRLWLSEAPVAREVSARPRATKFGRLQAALDGRAPNVYHACEALGEPWHCSLFTLLDGTRDADRLAEELAALMATPEGLPATPEQVVAATLEERRAWFRGGIPAALATFHRKGLLV